jgi:hypothetical protein
MSGVAATVDDADKKKALLTGGIIATGVGSLGFGLGAALGLQKRAVSSDAVASSQEIAAAVLLSDSASQEAWGRAFATCATDQGSLAAARPENASDVFRQASGIGASASSPVDGGTDGGKPGADAQAADPSLVPTMMDGGTPDGGKSPGR